MKAGLSKIVLMFCVALLGLCLAGCGTKSYYVQAPGAQALSLTNGFIVGQVNDLSGFQFNDGDTDAFDLKIAMSTALQAELAKQSMIAGNAPYNISVNIMEYSPGNAFTRWLMPGTGTTRLSVEAMIEDNSGAQIAKIPVERHISTGGGFTIGAYKYIFEDVAQEIAAVMKKQAKGNGK